MTITVVIVLAAICVKAIFIIDKLGKSDECTSPAAEIPADKHASKEAISHK